jgi:Zn-finger nucleic acid-binding protein
MKCPYCKKETTEKSRKCVHCGRVVRKIRTRDPRMPVSCPSCSIKSDILMLGSVEIDYCYSCGGVWFDRGEIRAFEESVADPDLADDIKIILQELRAPSTPEKTKMYFNCPVCKNTMARKNFAQVSGIVLDRCPDHGTWVKHNEAIKLVEILSEVGIEELQVKADGFKKDDIDKRVRELQARQTFQEIELSRVRRFAWAHAVLDLLGFM